MGNNEEEGRDNIHADNQIFLQQGNTGCHEAQPEHYSYHAQRHMLDPRLLCGGRHFIYSGREIADIEFQNSIPAISFIKQEKELGFLPAPFLRFGIIRTAP